MATHDSFNIAPFWDDEYKHLTYKKEQFNDPATMIEWEDAGFRGPFGGYMCDMRSPQPQWNKTFIDIYSEMGWKDIGTSYYRMNTGTTLPVHSDLYTKYISLFNLKGREHTIRRAIVLLEDWKSGHYLEVIGVPVVNWTAGTVIEWTYDASHMAANIGLNPRYTLQITGHVDDE
jgi:hypothetical protein